MQLTTITREVKEHTLTLSEADLAALFADPQAFANGLRRQLNGDAHPQRKTRAPKAHGRGKSGQRQAAPANPKPDLICPHCAQVFKQPKRLSNHLANEHPNQTTA